MNFERKALVSSRALPAVVEDHAEFNRPSCYRSRLLTVFQMVGQDTILRLKSSGTEIHKIKRTFIALQSRTAIDTSLPLNRSRPPPPFPHLAHPASQVSHSRPARLPRRRRHADPDPSRPAQPPADWLCLTGGKGGRPPSRLAANGTPAI